MAVEGSRISAIPKSRKLATPSVVDDNVSGLDVAMDHQVLVRILHRGAYLDEQLKAFRHGQLLSVTVFIDRSAFDQFHHEVRDAFVCRAAIQQSCDVGMVERGTPTPDVRGGSAQELRSCRVRARTNLMATCLSYWPSARLSAIHLTHAPRPISSRMLYAPIRLPTRLANGLGPG